MTSQCNNTQFWKDLLFYFELNAISDITTQIQLRRTLFYYNNMAQLRSFKYAKISLKKRQKLVSLVNENNMSVSRAAIRLGISSSTAKMIFKRYREEGTFFEARSDRGKRLQRQRDNQFSFPPSEDRENLRNHSENQEDYQQNNSPNAGTLPFIDRSNDLAFSGDCFIHPWMFFGNNFYFPISAWQN